ncbi:MAG TPA: four helix bundle protein [Pyrinomonadaceae bacterium]|nr:four helix bundle protein [Pyrinomonadaceae bacterium]
MSDVRRQEIKSHRDLIVWQKSMDLVTAVYKLTDDFPKSELYGLTSQIRRCAASIPANIAEGQGRRLAGEFLQFLGNARGSLLELDTHLEIAVRLGMLNRELHSTLMEQLIEVRKLLNGLMRSIRTT